MTSLPIITAQIIATRPEIREQLVGLVDNGPRISVVASVTINDAEEALNQISPLLIIAHGETETEVSSLHIIAKKHTQICFMLIVSDVTAPKADGKGLNFVTSVNKNNIKLVIPGIISNATQTIINPVQNNYLKEEQGRLENLTRKELEILKLTASGLKINEIAQQLHRSHSTVAKHRENLMKKLHMHDRVALTRLAIREGLINA